MYTLKFNTGTIGKYKNTDKCWEKIKEYIDETLHFKSYYYNCSYLEDKKSIRVDYGSHTNFFYIMYEEDKNESEE